MLGGGLVWATSSLLCGCGNLSSRSWGLSYALPCPEGCPGLRSSYGSAASRSLRPGPRSWYRCSCLRPPWSPLPLPRPLPRPFAGPRRSLIVHKLSSRASSQKRSVNNDSAACVSGEFPMTSPQVLLQSHSKYFMSLSHKSHSLILNNAATFISLCCRRE